MSSFHSGAISVQESNKIRGYPNNDLLVQFIPGEEVSFDRDPMMIHQNQHTLLVYLP
jgi:hypothetical protein